MKRTICTAVLLALAVLSTGCVTSVNVIVAPHAGLTIDSFKDSGDQYADTYLTDEGEYEVLPQGQVL